MIKLRKAQINESEKILNFYKNLIFSIRNSEFNPKWNENYPDLKFIENSIFKEELFVYAEESIIACVVINDELGEDYGNVEWHVNAEPDEILAIHAFAVNSMGNGIGKEIFEHIVKKAMEKNKKTIRIDVIDGNTGAEKVFRKLGFKYVDSVKAFHDAVGWQTFHLFEYDLE